MEVASMAAKLLEGLRWEPAYVAHLGCIKGCLNYLGVKITLPWLYGGTGHAFVVNVHEALCPSGPTAWNTRMLFDLAPNLGYRVDGRCTWKSAAGGAFRETQREAFEFVKAAIDRGLPCYGWQLEVPEYYVLCGYDDVGYYYSGCTCDGVKGPLPWEKLGDWDVTLLEVHSVQPGAVADVAKTVKDALAMALRHAEGPAEWIHPGYRSGPAAFELWAEALAGGRASRDGCAYNAQVWRECRAMAVEFVKEAKARLPGRCDGAFDEAARQYASVRDRLSGLLELHPAREGWNDQERLKSPEGAAAMREAAEAERRGLECLKEIASAL
jgi:hypothetical protein